MSQLSPEDKYRPFFRDECHVAVSEVDSFCVRIPEEVSRGRSRRNDVLAQYRYPLIGQCETPFINMSLRESKAFPEPLTFCLYFRLGKVSLYLLAHLLERHV